jgi:hypothetical protein
MSSQAMSDRSTLASIFYTNSLRPDLGLSSDLSPFSLSFCPPTTSNFSILISSQDFVPTNLIRQIQPMQYTFEDQVTTKEEALIYPSSPLQPNRLRHCHNRFCLSSYTSPRPPKMRLQENNNKNTRKGTNVTCFLQVDLSTSLKPS